MSGDSDPYFATRLKDAVIGTRFERIGWVPETGSTNDDLAAAAAEGANEQVLVTDLQTAGRGRRNRQWHANRNAAVLMSLLIRDSDLDPFWAVGAVALAGAEAVSSLTTEPCMLKWPNDLLLGGRKVAGVLAQVADQALVVGIGINATWGSSRPSGVPDEATAIDGFLAEGIEEVDRVELVAAIVSRSDELLGLGVSQVRPLWIERCATLGQQVRIERGEGEALVGEAVDVSSDGALLLRAGAETTQVRVGDVVHLRGV